MTRATRYVIAGSLALGLAAILTPTLSGVRVSAQPPSGAPRGQTTTRLPDGRWLIVGGELAGEPIATARVVDPRSGAVLTEVALTPARAWHTATVLADGTVLIAGGTRRNGQTVAVPELFDPATATLTPLTVAGAAARSGHTATLLTDGRVLVVGGLGSDGRPAAVEIWQLDGEVKTARPIAGTSGWEGHTATLLPDGTVLIEGGRDGDGRPHTRAQVFDPSSGTLADGEAPAIDRSAPALTGSQPADGAHDVGITARIVLRFSTPLAMDSTDAGTVSLSTGDTPVALRVVPAEGGRLLFVLPNAPLTPDTSYVLSVQGATNDRGVPMRPGRLAFITASDATTPAGSDTDTETWLPEGRPGTASWRTGRPASSWPALPPLQARPGVTALAGQVLRLDGQPLARVSLTLEGHSTESDRTGRFLLELPDAGAGRAELLIDGRSANRPGRTYGLFEYGLTLAAGQTTVLPFTIWMPRLDTAHAVKIASPTTSEVVVTTPYIAGLELHLPAGTTIRDEDGQIVREITITPIPVDRPPFPLPQNVEVPIYFTIQPGSAYVSTAGPGPKGAWLVYPNYRQESAGQRIQFFHYDPDGRGWYVYGLGTVTPNGAQVMPDATTRIYAFTGAMINGAGTPPAEAPPPGNCACATGADPVDLTTGLFTLEETDLSLPDVLPIAVTRSYRTRDLQSRPFGVGTTHPYAMFLWSAQEYQQADLILPDGARIHYVRTSAGTLFNDAVFVHQETPTTSATPTAFYKSVMTWNGTGWDIRLKDGSVYVFGDRAPLQAIRDRFGNTITIAHASGQLGNVTRVTSPFGRWIAFTYDGGNRITQAKDNIGRTVTYTYDAGGNLATVTDPENHVTSYTYDSSHRMLTVKPPNLQGTATNLVTTEYTTAADAPTPVGWVKKQTHANGGIFQIVYTVVNGKSTQTDLTDPRGFVRRVTFNSDGYSLSNTSALGQPEEQTSSSQRLAGSNLVTAMTDGLGRRTESTYDSSGSVLTETRLAGTADAVTTTFTYEPLFHQLATVTDPLMHTWTQGHSAAGTLTSVTDPMSHQTTVELNAAGLVTSMTDPLTHVWQFGYAGGDLTTTTDPLGAVRRRFLDAAGRERSATDPLGRVSQTAVDKLSRVTSLTDAAGGQTSLSYDANGNLVYLTDALGHATSYTYNTRDGVATSIDPLTHATSYQYDPNGNLTQVTDRKGQATGSQYDALDRLTQVTYADTSTIAYTYDAGDRMTQVVDSTNGTIIRMYDDLDRLTQEITPQGTVDYTHDADGRRATMTVAGQTVVSYAYDNAHRLTSITQGASVVSLTYDDSNRRNTLTYPNGIVATSGYDNANRLTSLIYTLGPTTVGDLAYAYDANGSRTTVGGSWARTGIPVALTSATYDAANRLTTWNSASFSYDANGNLGSDGPTSYAWDARNQLAALSGGVDATFGYDAIGRRRSKTVGSSTTFLYDGMNLVQELTSGGSPIANLLSGLIVDETFLRTDQNGTSALLTDVLGSTLALADASGDVQTSYSFDPFGATSVMGASSANSLGFQGRENDETGLYYYRARYLHSGTARFVSEDQIAFSDTFNLFTFVGNSPTNYVDPTGHSKIVEKMESQLPDGRIFNKKTSERAIREAIRDAERLCWSKGTKDFLKGLLKVVRRGGVAAVLLDIFLDPVDLISAECPAGPGTCRPNQPYDGGRRDGRRKD
jgi:RHS repeat-associated protein